MANQYKTPPAMTIDPAKSYSAEMETERGTIHLTLYAAQAPVTVNNFVFLAREGFFDNTVFHRVVPDFVIQGGDPDATGRGGPGYRWDDEPAALKLRHDTGGVLSMANAGPNTNGSQFFVTHRATPHLDGKHAVFGKVADLDSMAVVEAVKQGDSLIRVTIHEA